MATMTRTPLDLETTFVKEFDLQGRVQPLAGPSPHSDGMKNRPVTHPEREEGNSLEVTKIY
jgi:hypothetical protein